MTTTLDLVGLGFSPSIGTAERDYVTGHTVTAGKTLYSSDLQGEFVLCLTAAEWETWSNVSEPARRGILEYSSRDCVIALCSPEAAMLWERYPPLVCSLLPVPRPLVIFGRKMRGGLGNLGPGNLPGSSLEVAQRLASALVQDVPCEVVFSEETIINEWPRSWPRSELVPGHPDRQFEGLQKTLVDLDLGRLLPRACSGADATAFKAGMLLLHDDLPASHQLSQSIEGQGKHRAGDYWHAILHRREPDYGNAKYWFRSVGEHPIFQELGEFARDELKQIPQEVLEDGEQNRLFQGSAGWNAAAFVDLCRQAQEEDSADLRDFAERVQRREMWLLLASTWRDACEESAG